MAYIRKQTVTNSYFADNIILLNGSVACFHFKYKMLVIKNNTKGPQNDINFLAQLIF